MYEQIYISCYDTCTYMEKPEWTKTIGFRLPPRTLEQLDELIEDGLIRNRTEGVLLAVDRMYNSEKNAEDELLVLNLILSSVANKPEEYKNLAVEIKNILHERKDRKKQLK